MAKTKEFKFKDFGAALHQANHLYFGMSYTIHSLIKFNGYWVVTYSE